MISYFRGLIFSKMSMYFVVVLYIKDFTKDVVGKLVSYRFHILNED